MNYRMTAVDPVEHLMAVAQLTSDTYANGQYVNEIAQQLFKTSHYDWETSRLLWDDQKLIHHWGVWGYPMRLGSVHLKTAGIGAVVTVEAYRKQGIMDRAARDSFKAMVEHGYDVTVLRGRHYAKYGYVRAWNYVTYRLKPAEFPSTTLEKPYQALGPEHMDAIIALYNRDYADYTGTVVRPSFRMAATGDMEMYGWFDAAGALEGYVRAVPTPDKKTLQCFEAVGDPDQGFAVLQDLFKQGEYETYTFFTLPHAHPMLKRLRRGACLVEDQYFYHTGWQVRIVNLHTTLEKMRPLFEAQLQASSLAQWQGDLILQAGEHNASLTIDRGQVQITTVGTSEHRVEAGAALGRLLVGSDEPQEIIEQNDIVCTGQAAALVAVLFPNRYPMMSHLDEY